MHLGVARGILAHEGGPVVAEKLDPMVGPSHCILHLGLVDEEQARSAPEGLVE